MRTGNYLTQDRMVALATAADNVVMSVRAIHKELEIFLANGGDYVSTEAIRDILNRHQLDYIDLKIIYSEQQHFSKKRQKSNEQARNAMRYKRDAALERKLFSLDVHSLAALDFSNDPNPFPSPISLPGTGVSSHAERGVQSDNRELHELHAELIAAFGSGTFINVDQAMMLLQVEQPTIDALVNNDYLRLSTLPGRYLIAEV